MESRRLIPAIECNDQTLLVFGVVYVARLYFAMLVLWSRPPDWHEIPIVYVFFIPSIFYTMARGKIDECSAPVTAVAVALYVGRDSRRSASINATFSRSSPSVLGVAQINS